jgi:hypothetical protein
MSRYATIAVIFMTFLIAAMSSYFVIFPRTRELQLQEAENSIKTIGRLLKGQNIESMLSENGQPDDATDEKMKQTARAQKVRGDLELDLAIEFAFVTPKGVSGVRLSDEAQKTLEDFLLDSNFKISKLIDGISLAPQVIDKNDGSWLIAGFPVKGKGLILLRPVDSIDKPFSELALWIFITMGLGFVILVGVVMFFGDSLSRSISKLQVEAVEMLQGDFGKTFKVRGPIEIRALARTLNKLRMTKDLKKKDGMIGMEGQEETGETAESDLLRYEKQIAVLGQMKKETDVDTGAKKKTEVLGEEDAELVDDDSSQSNVSALGLDDEKVAEEKAEEDEVEEEKAEEEKAEEEKAEEEKAEEEKAEEEKDEEIVEEEKEEEKAEEEKEEEKVEEEKEEEKVEEEKEEEKVEEEKEEEKVEEEKEEEKVEEEKEEEKVEEEKEEEEEEKEEEEKEEEKAEEKEMAEEKAEEEQIEEEKTQERRIDELKEAVLEENEALPKEDSQMPESSESKDSQDDEDSPEDYYKNVFKEFVDAKHKVGEGSVSMDFDMFVQRLKKQEEKLKAKHGCRGVKFSVIVKGDQVSLKPNIIK